MCNGKVNYKGIELVLVIETALVVVRVLEFGEFQSFHNRINRHCNKLFRKYGQDPIATNITISDRTLIIGGTI